MRLLEAICDTLKSVLEPRAHGRWGLAAGAFDQRRLAFALGACALALEAGFLSLLRLGRLADDVPAFIVHYLLISLAYFVACWLVAAPDRGGGRGGGWRWIWGAALLFRLTVLPLPPSLSEDAVRYRWQGMLQAAGGEPYRDTPEEAEWTGLRDATWPNVTGKDKPSAYGPLLEQIFFRYFLLASRLTDDPWRQVWLFKIPFALADLAAAAAVMALLAALGRPRRWALIYLWSPLAVIEFWAEGHNDAFAVASVAAALALAVKGRSTWALLALTCGTLFKFWPAVLTPFLLVSKAGNRWRVHWRGAAACLPVALLVCLPHWQGLLDVGFSVGGFFGGWCNNDSVFGAVLALFGGDYGRAAMASQGLLLAAVAAFQGLRAVPLRAELATICALLLLSSNCFPWYLTWMLPLLAARPVAPLLLWTALAGLAYHVVIGYEATGAWEYDRSLVALEYAPVLTWLAIFGVARMPKWLRARSTGGRGRGGRPD